MNSISEELKDEIEALQAIYGNNFKISSKESTTIQITDPESSVTFTFILDDLYPLSIPEIMILSSRTDTPEILQNLKNMAQEMLGSVMIFDLVTTTQEWISEHPDTSLTDDFIRPTVIEDRKLAAGTPVTAELFKLWHSNYVKEKLEEISLLKNRALDSANSKLTGRELFELKRVDKDEDLDMVEDEALFEGMELLSVG